MFQVTELAGGAGGEWRRTPKTHPIGCVLGALQEENGEVDAKHVKHVHLDVFDVFEGEGWI